MRTEHFLFHVIGITPKSMVKFVQSNGISLSILFCDIFTHFIVLHGM